MLDDWKGEHLIRAKPRQRPLPPQNMTPMRARILDAMDAPMTTREAADASGCSPNTVLAAMRFFEAEKLVRRAGKVRTPDGRQWAFVWVRT